MTGIDLKKWAESLKKPGEEDLRMSKFTQQFNNFTLRSEKKLRDNRLKVELKLQSTKSNKNIILQALDLVEEFEK